MNGKPNTALSPSAEVIKRAMRAARLRHAIDGPPADLLDLIAYEPLPEQLAQALLRKAITHWTGGVMPPPAEG